MRRSVFLFCFILFYFFIHTFLVKFMKSLYSVIKHKMKQKERKKKGRKRKKKKEKNSSTKKKKMPVGLPRISWAKICADFGLQAFVTFTQNSFFEYIWCYVFINSYSHHNFSRPVLSCWLYCLVFNSIQNHTITCIQNCMEFQCPLYLHE